MSTRRISLKRAVAMAVLALALQAPAAAQYTGGTPPPNGGRDDREAQVLPAGPEVRPNPGPLVRTGSDVAGLALIGLGMVGAGVTVRVLRRR